jgi:integrating conjugative element relaxase (TIGR03760 family)
LEAKALIATLKAEALLAGIRNHSHASADNFIRYYSLVIDRFLEFAQLLPASESHHHAQPGGMALHTLETVQHALQRRQGMMLPPGSPTEVQQRQQHRWTYAVFVAALLHDVGKAAHDLRVTYDSPTHAGAAWNPLTGSLLELRAITYRVDFAHGGGRDYAAHRRFPLALLPKFVPPPVLSWLADDGALLPELADYLCGERRDGKLAELVAVGDRESVRRNLLIGSRQRFANAGTVPLIERLMGAMRRMLADSAWLPLNRDGAAGWVFDEAVWFVSKRLADEVRRFLESQGDSAVPGEDKNDRLFDVWQEYGALAANPLTGGAIWRARVEGVDYAHDLTLLRFPVTRLWSDVARFPQAMHGRIVVLPPADPSVEPRTRGATANPEVANHDTADQESKGEPRARTDELDAADDAANIQPRASPSLVSLQPVAPDIGPLPSFANVPAPKQPSALALEFMAWVQRGVAEGTLRYNETGALVHFVTEGIFLASPGIFRAYAEAHPGAPNAEPDNPQDWPGKNLQKAVCGAGWNEKGPRNKNVLSYQVAGRDGKLAKILNGVVLMQPERFFDPVPPPNPHLRRAEVEGGKAAG